MRKYGWKLHFRSKHCTAHSDAAGRTTYTSGRRPIGRTIRTRMRQRQNLTVYDDGYYDAEFSDANRLQYLAVPTQDYSVRHPIFAEL